MNFEKTSICARLKALFSEREIAAQFALKVLTVISSLTRPGAQGLIVSFSQPSSRFVTQVRHAACRLEAQTIFLFICKLAASSGHTEPESVFDS